MPMGTRPFTHLHCHTHYSLLDGASSIPKLVSRAKEHGFNSLAITDHGNLHGALQFYQECHKNDINPIIGYEAYIAPGSRFEKSGGIRDSNYHLTLLAQNRTGFKNLVKMASHAYLEGFYFKPRIDKQLLEDHSEGIICLSGCVSSEFNQAILKGYGDIPNLDKAIEASKWFESLFGDRYFIEVMNNGIEIQRMALEGAVAVAKKLGTPVVATSDCHYVDPQDAEAQDVMLCINTGRFRTDTSRMKMDGNEYYLKNAEEMYQAFPGMEDAVSRTQEIADTVDIDLELGKRYFPSFKLPDQRDSTQYLRDLCEQGLRERYEGDSEMVSAEGVLAEVVQKRLDRELSVIEKLGFDDYFLICWDFVVVARERGIPATARGSGVGAIVCFALYLSHVCPIKYDLLFERFLDENRLEAPDIDIDFCKDRRGEVIQYVKEEYGEANVAQIGTFGTLAAKASIKDVGRALGIPLHRVNQITGMVPEELKITISSALDKSADMKMVYDSDPEIREMLDLAMRIEGLARNVGTHAAAVVIADEPLTEYVPLCRVSGKEDVITQWSMNDVEAAGLLKMDFLGLRNLTILRIAVDLIEQTTGERIDPLKFPLDDKETFALLCRGETKGVFQLESGGIRDLLQRMKPDHFLDIIATNALYRPGPLEGGMVDDYIAVKHGQKEATYEHPVLKDILEETHGVMVYQEQVMRILNRLGGIELASAYTCIKAISKKKEAIIQANREDFLKGAVEQGLTQKVAENFWNMIVKFAGYGFNKSHSTAYALIAYQTAYLKAHYSVEFMAALLTGDIPGRNFMRKDSLIEHIEDCERMGIEVVPPSVNTSGVEFTVDGKLIYFGMSAIKGCGGSAAEALVVAREAAGPFKDIFDLCERVETSRCNKSSLENLIKAGALDCFGGNRRQLTEVLERAIQAGQAMQADNRSGQQNLFGAFEESEDTEEVSATADLPQIEEYPERERLMMEKEVLGYYLTAHPLDEHMDKLKQFTSHTTNKLIDIPDRGEVILGGMISSIKEAHTRNPKPGQPSKYANFDLEDVEGSVRCIMWPRQYAEFGHLIVPDDIVIIKGVVDRRGGGDECNMIINELVPLSQIEDRYTTGMIVRLQESTHGMQMIPKLREVTRAYPGRRKLQLLVQLADGTSVTLDAQGQGVDINNELRNRIDDLLGGGNIQMITRAPKVQNSGRRFGS
ncbi:MAG: DNA polymerase III subunit alpha [Rhodopirellula sp.]|nr:DNA polymerase III subunit alpha [Rhodopirellula sp.]